MATYDKSSPYYNTPQTSTYLEYWNAPTILSSNLDGVVVITDRYKHRPDQLSYDLYGTPRLWWVFALVNPDKLQDPIYDMVPGIEIRFPDKNNLQGYL